MKKLGYDPDNILIIDDNKDCHISCKERVLQIEKWKGEEDDIYLEKKLKTVKEMLMKI